MKVTRGSTIKLWATDIGDIVPEAVLFRLNYPDENRCRKQVDIDGAPSPIGEDWIANWDSSVASIGTVHVSALASYDTHSVVVEGAFQLTGNFANLLA